MRQRERTWLIRLPAASAALGRDAGVRVRMLPARAFYAGVPAAFPHQGACYAALSADGQRRTDVAWELWGEEVLARALVAPRLAIEDLWVFGADLEPLVHAYLEAAGFFVSPAGPDFPAQLLELARRMSRRSGRLPSELLALPVDAFNLNARILVPEWFPAGPESAEPAPVYTNDPGLMGDGH